MRTLSSIDSFILRRARLLEQMEKALYAEDPKFATSLRSTPGARAARGRAALGVLGVLGGLGLLIVGAAVGWNLVGTDNGNVLFYELL